jgi:hypothetical protein
MRTVIARSVEPGEDDAAISGSLPPSLAPFGQLRRDKSLSQRFAMTNAVDSWILDVGSWINRI